MLTKDYSARDFSWIENYKLLMRRFPYAVKIRDFLKSIIFQIERDSIKGNNFISFILFLVPPKHNENV